MEIDKIKEIVINLIVDKGYDEEEVLEAYDQSMDSSLGIDSLDKIEVILAFETEFQISIKDENWESRNSIKAIVEGCIIPLLEMEKLIKEYNSIGVLDSRGASLKARNLMTVMEALVIKYKLEHPFHQLKRYINGSN